MPGVGSVLQGWRQRVQQSISDARQSAINNTVGADLPSMSHALANLQDAILGQSVTGGPGFNVPQIGQPGILANSEVTKNEVGDVQAAIQDPTVGLQAIANYARTSANGVGGWDASTFLDAVQADVWGYPPGGFAGPLQTSDLITYAGVTGEVIAFIGCVRWLDNANFLVNCEGTDPTSGTINTVDLSLASPSNKLSRNESDYAMLVRLYPGYLWVPSWNGSQFPGANITAIPGGVPVNYIYVPQPPSLDEIYHLWDYTPSSGPPTRNGIDDFIRILSLLPLQF